MPDIANLVVRITGDEKSATDALNTVDKQVKEAGGNSGWKSVLSNALSFAGGLGIVDVAKEGFSLLKDNIGEFISAGEQANTMDAILAQGLRSTHDASGQTADSLQNLADKLVAQAGITDDATKGAEQMLLTFTGIGKDVFPQATQAVADMATRLNGGAIPSAQQMSQVALQLGKALNDPATGMTALRREGVTFTAEQQQQIKAMEKAGNTAGAQKLMLAELSKEFGGSAAAAGQANGGMAIFGATMDDLKEKVGQALLPVLTGLLQNVVGPLATAFATVLPKAIGAVQGAIQTVAPIFQTIWGYLKDFASVLLQDIQPGLSQLGNALSKVHGPAFNVQDIIHKIVQVGQSLYPIIDAIGKGFNQLVAFVVPLIPHLQQLAGWLLNLIKQDVLANLRILGQIFDTVKTAVMNLLPHLQPLVAAFQQNILPAIQFLVPLVLNLAQIIGQILAKAFQIVMPIVAFLAGILANVLAGAITVVGAIIRAVVPIIEKLASWLGEHLAPIIKNVSQTLSELHAWFNDKVLPILNKVWGFIQANVLPILETLAKVYIKGVETELGLLWAVFSNVILPILGKVAGFVANQIGVAFQNFGNGIHAVTGFIGNLFDAIGRLLGQLGKLKDAAGHALDGLKNIPGIGGLLPHLASGGFTPGGPFIGAEDGPELLVKPGVYAAPPGSRVYSASDTARVLGSRLYPLPSASGGAGGAAAGSVVIGPGTSLSIPVHVAGHNVATAVLPDLARALGNGAAIRHS